MKRRVRGSYVDIAAAVWGSTVGGRLVLVAQLIELLMTCILYVLLCGELMVGVFPSTPLDLTAWIRRCGTRPNRRHRGRDREHIVENKVETKLLRPRLRPRPNSIDRDRNFGLQIEVETKFASRDRAQ